MNVLLLGSGGREHAIAWKLKQSEKCKQLYIAPGNVGTSLLGENCSISPLDFKAIEDFVLAKNIDLLIPASEEALVSGIYDYFANQSHTKHIMVIGPSKAGAQLEGSKDFSKQFMLQQHIPTAQYATFSKDNFQDGLAYIQQMKTPIVLKADGLAAGKGVVIASDVAQAQQTFHEMLVDEKFGNAGKKVVIEEFLDGIEFSVFVLTDGKSFQILPVAKDYKKIGENDSGLNTGGMGAVTPLDFVDEKLMQKVVQQIVIPTLSGLKSNDILYKGFLYFGLIKVGDHPFVIEYNCRMGDPETQVVMPMIESDLLPYLEAVGKNNLSAMPPLKIKEGACCTTVLVSKGYPETYESQKAISGLDALPENCIVFHAGTKISDNQLLSNGGRVLAVSAFGKQLSEACNISRNAAAAIQFSNKYFRKDIGLDVQKTTA